MQRHFEKDLEGLKLRLVKMGSIVEESLQQSTNCLRSRDPVMAKAILEADDEINSLEIRIDNAIIDLLALNQPVASDLRLILAAQKINNDLERMGDHAVNIAESAIYLDGTKMQSALTRIMEMSDLALQMVHKALDAFIHMEASLARWVLDHDDVVDNLNKALVTHAIAQMKADPSLIETGLDFIRVSRNLERVADLSTNIAEEVIFVAKAIVVKHGAGEG